MKSLQNLVGKSICFSGGLNGECFQPDGYLGVVVYMCNRGKVPTTVKLDEDRKKKLEKLLARIFVEEGKKVSLQEALGRAVDTALEDDEFLRDLAELPPLEEDPAWKMLKKPKHWNIEDASENIDEHIYGDR